MALNPQTAVEDVKALRPGCVCISSGDLKLVEIRPDVKHYQVPFTELAARTTDNIKLPQAIDEQ